jgi:hypothetical protein
MYKGVKLQCAMPGMVDPCRVAPPSQSLICVSWAESVGWHNKRLRKLPEPI